MDATTAHLGKARDALRASPLLVEGDEAETMALLRQRAEAVEPEGLDRFAEPERLQAAFEKPGSADGVEGTLCTLKEMTPPLVAN